MKRLDTVDTIKGLLKQMSHICFLAKVSETQIPLIIKRIESEQVKGNYPNAVLKALNNMQDLFTEAVRARGLVDESTWNTYMMMGYEGLREQDILAKALKEFRLAWKELPLYRKNLHVKLNSQTTKKK